MSLFPDPTAMVLFQYERLHTYLCNETVREHDPHSALAPLITLGTCNSSAVWCLWNQEEEGEKGRAK